MGGCRIPGPICSETAGDLDALDDYRPPGAGFEQPGPIEARVSRIIANVTKDWDSPNPRTTPDIVVGGTTLEQAAKELNRLSEWGEGGGMLRAEPIPAGTSTDLTVTLHANLVKRLPQWKGYGAASTAAKAEWDRMLGALRIHEERHVEIAIEEADNLAATLVGREIGEIAGLVTAANRTMARRQKQLDDDTESASKPGVKYGNVSLDTTIR